MADFQSHINQAKRNLSTLYQLNQNTTDSWDWQVTIAYYVGVHLMNAHIAKKGNLHYKTHEKVKIALFDDMSPCKIPEDIYISYVKLENLSRRARYLCHEDKRGDHDHAFFTFDKHFKKALIQLNQLMIFFEKEQDIQFSIIDIDCIEIKSLSLFYFPYKQNTNQFQSL